uniref:Uncharacterized protein n=1 Tax=Anguilla anguilla TaxID=7936 RepID=A0A0E9WA15_ANGAN
MTTDAYTYCVEYFSYRKAIKSSW